MTNTSTNTIKEFAKAIIEGNAGRSTFKRGDLLQYARTHNIPDTDVYKHICKPEYRAQRGYYDLKYIASDAPIPTNVSTAKPVVKTVSSIQTAKPLSSVSTESSLNMVTSLCDEVDTITYVPSVNSNYVKWGHSTDVETIIKSGSFFPIYVCGPSGNGKTMMIEQACAKTKRQFIRVNISPETDEDDLIGGFRLQDGNTVFVKGPVIRAMEEGAILCLDEIDRATNKIMCLQSVLEGNSVLLKKTGETIAPRHGFNVIATANTSGRGSEDGRYTAASIIDDAFLERFPITINQTWAPKGVETKIVLNAMRTLDCVDEQFADRLITWARVIRSTYEAEGVDDVISTRRLDHIVKAFSVFKDRVKAITLSVNRFSPETTAAFIDLYTKIDSGEIKDPDEVAAAEEEARKKNVNEFGHEIPF